MKTIRYSILLIVLVFLAGSCGDNLKDSIPGLTTPLLSTKSEIASTVQSIHTSNELSTEVFMVLGPLGSLIGSGAASVSAAATETTLEKTLAFIRSYKPEGGFYVVELEELEGSSYVFFLKTVVQVFPPINNNKLYLEIMWALNYDDPEQEVYVYQGLSVTSNQIDVKVTGNFESNLPGPWRGYIDNEPINSADQWLSVNEDDFVDYDITNEDGIINPFLKEQISKNYNGMAVITYATQGDKTIETYYTVDRGAGIRPTNDEPAHQKGYGTIIYSDGKVLTIKDYDLLIGENGPIGGKVETERSDGFTTTLTYSLDGSSSGKIEKGDTLVADINLNADGTGTYTDYSGISYPID